MKRTLPSLAGQPLEGQRAFVRVDFNVPLDQGKVTDATRVRAAVPTITWLRERGCRVVLASHLGRPKGIPRPELSLQPVVRLLETELGVPVDFRSDLGAETARATQRLGRGQVLLLENTRFWPGEETNDLELAQMFADLSDIYVNDAFGTAHRAHASTEGVAHLVKPAVAGLLMARELTYLEGTLEDSSHGSISRGIELFINSPNLTRYAGSVLSFTLYFLFGHITYLVELPDVLSKYLLESY